MEAKLKTQAILLRKKGKSYRDILHEVHVSKSTLSYWLRNVVLQKSQKENLNKRRILAAKKGALQRRYSRISKTKEVIAQAHKDIKSMSDAELLLIGTCLYWAEGSKQRPYNLSQRVCFTNSDPKMVKLFLLWLDRICNTHTSDLIFELYIHGSVAVVSAVEYWKKELKIDSLLIRIKKNKLGTNRKKVDKNYQGLIRITVRKSTSLNRRITGWIGAIVKQWGVV